MPPLNEQFQAIAAEHNQGRPRHLWRYPKSARALALKYFELNRKTRLVEEIAGDLGIGFTTLYRWRRERNASSGPALRPVRVDSNLEEPNDSADSGQALSVVTPSGLRIEGLSLEQTIQLAQVLR